MNQIVVRILEDVRLRPLFQPRKVSCSERRHGGEVEVEAEDEVLGDRDRDVELVSEDDQAAEVAHRGLDNPLVHDLETIRFYHF